MAMEWKSHFSFALAINIDGACVNLILFNLTLFFFTINVFSLYMLSPYATQSGTFSFAALNEATYVRFMCESNDGMYKEREYLKGNKKYNDEIDNNEEMKRKQIRQ